MIGNNYFAAYAPAVPDRLDLCFTVNIHDPKHENGVLLMKGLSALFPECRWTQGITGHAPAGDYQFLASAV